MSAPASPSDGERRGRARALPFPPLAGLGVKICGVTRVEDALLAVRLGADAIGLNLWPGSKRCVTVEAARAIAEALPASVAAVGVFVDPTRDEVLRAAERAGLDTIQLHGDEPPELAAALPFPVLKAIRVGGRDALALLARYEVEAFLLDAPSPGYGGSGATFDWDIAAEAARTARVILAGGLVPGNVAEAIRRVRPCAVDVASGVERAPGVKDPEKLTAFMKAAKAVKEQSR